MSAFEIKDNDIQIVLNLISSFIKGHTGSLPLNLRKNTTIIHYYNEIIRFWNKLNFIIKKTLKVSDTLESDKLSLLLYATYRLLWEHASEKELLNEIEVIDKEFLYKVKNFSWRKAFVHKDEKEKLSISEAIPSFMINHLLPVMSINFLKDSIKFMNGIENNIEITVRVNTLYGRSNHEESSIHIKENFKKNLKVEYTRDGKNP